MIILSNPEEATTLLVSFVIITIGTYLYALYDHYSDIELYKKYNERLYYKIELPKLKDNIYITIANILVFCLIVGAILVKVSSTITHLL